MPVPDFQSLMLPVLKSAAAGDEVSNTEMREHVAAEVGLTDDDLDELLPSGRQTVFVNRTSWARLFMERAGLLETTKRGHFRITERGKELLAEKPERVDKRTLARYPEYTEWREKSNAAYRARAAAGTQDEDDSDATTPEERLEADHAVLAAALQEDLLARLVAASPAFFERVIVDLLIAMGYGGGRAEMGRAIGKSGDNGIDGVVKEDALGLDAVYVQAKKYAKGNVVGSSDLRNFSGALDVEGTTKGLFVTTSSFSNSAREYVSRIAKRIILVDGQELTRLMLEHNVGVRTRAVYEIKRIDEDFFSED